MELLAPVCLLLQVCAVFGQVPFYHTKSFTNIYPSEDVPKDGYFGYSSAYDYMSKKLVVSAPNADTVGQVFYCELDGSKCIKISDILFESMKNDSNVFIENYKITNHKFWLGATVRTEPQLILICAPRYATRNLHYDLLYSTYGTKGRCLWKGRHGWKILQYPKNPIGNLTGKFENLMSSLGWSVDMTRSLKLIGGPIMGIGRRGLVTVFRNNLNTPPYFLLENEDLLKANKINANFGYSVVIGSFIDRKGYFAVSSTYGQNGIGKVLIFKADNTLHSIVSEPNSMGIMYGASLCAAKLRGNRDDLLVGAPAYAKSTDYYDSGAVYIYSKQDNKYYMDLRLNLTGEYKGGYFGSAIINLGDIDHDGFEDVAIAAPYENEGRGHVYIYSGYDLKNSKTKPLQQLQAEGKSFGLSLAMMPDHDKNGCKELIIGAPSPNADSRSMVVLANCFTIITTDVKVDCEVYKTVSDAILFQVKSCVNVKYPKEIKDIMTNIEMKIRVDHSDAKLLKNITSMDLNDTTVESTYNKILDNTKLKQYCEKDIIVLPDEANHNMEIIVNVTAKLLNNSAEQEIFDKSQALLSARSQLNDKCLILPNYCNKTQCKPDLQLEVYPEWSPEEEYLVGSSPKETFSMSVTNVGQVAYAACVRGKARGVSVVGLPSWHNSRCDYDRADPTSTFVCYPNLHIDTNNTWDVGVVTLDTKTLNSDNTNFSIAVYVYNNCASNVSSPPQVIYTKLKYDYENVKIDGKSEEGNEVIVTKSDVENRKQLQHLYDIQNNGVTHFKQLTGIVTINKSPYYVMPNSSVQVTTETQNVEECLVTEDLDDEYTASCDLGDLSPGNMISVTAIIKITEFESNEKKNKPVFSTDFKLLFSDETKSIQANVSTIIKYQVAEEVSWWVILAAIILGILIVILVIFVLYEAGCLKRRNKEKLQDLKKEVRRQSVRRSMRLRNSNSSAMEGTQLIGPSEPESNERVNELYQPADDKHEAQVHAEPNNHTKL